MTKKIAVLPGDGIGSEIMEQAVRVLGALKLPGDTATGFRLGVLKPFLDRHLKTGAAKADIPPVLIFETGTMEWRRYDRWPEAGDGRRWGRRNDGRAIRHWQMALRVRSGKSTPR